jgi:hypothetical protein
MSNKLFVVEGCTLKLKLSLSGDITINPLTSVLSQVAKALGKKVYKVIGFTIANATNGAVTGGTGIGIVQGNSTMVKGDNVALVREDAESAQITISGVIGSSPATYLDTVIIVDAGQDVFGGN